jgi:hypothetical protein
MSGKVLGPILIALGIVLGLVAALADPLGLGHEGSGFGWKQVVGLAAGVVLVLGGLLLSRRQTGAPGS